ncbi:hypothetical protein [Microvirga puerhi]|uniref:Uncharacterized protein n=1 Tax=Microvirga puerhi TaxID=2876078 RepID=A0ABS7VI74_9HYPH|nr:hypothetical protein [Microvirga puerhi]MBZ6074722.1 hypothetical protein [Microvirga puerhi]
MVQRVTFWDFSEGADVRYRHPHADALVCRSALDEACHILEVVRIEWQRAKDRHLVVRRGLHRMLAHAYRRQSFAPLKILFHKEEEALKDREAAARRLATAEERWRALQIASVYEQETMTVGPFPRRAN